jgi:hypothetical protein
MEFDIKSTSPRPHSNEDTADILTLKVTTAKCTNLDT